MQRRPEPYLRRDVLGYRRPKVRKVPDDRIPLLAEGGDDRGDSVKTRLVEVDRRLRHEVLDYRVMAVVARERQCCSLTVRGVGRN